jgi:beta-fructofuranosidase
MYLQTIPRAIQLHKSGKQLVQWPIVEVEKLRANNVNWPTKILNGGGELLKINGVTAAQVNYVFLINYYIIKLFIRTELKLILNGMQADVEISFEVNNIEDAEVLDNWIDPRVLCSESSSIKRGLGPFGLLVFASKGLKEFTSVFFRIFNYQQKHLVLFCSDQTRFVLKGCIILIQKIFIILF